MKTSKYNFMIKDEDSSYIYNSRTNAFAQVLVEDKEIIQKLLNNPNQELNDEKKCELRKQMQYGGYIIEDNRNEIDEQRFLHLSTRYSPNLGRTVSIMTTQACNFRCKYCYEDIKPFTITEEIEDKVIEYLEKNTNKGIGSFDITWYGGEPLLTLPIMRRFSKKIKKYAKRFNLKKYSCMVITNGYLLDRLTKKMLKELKVRAIQVTIDGPEKVHDSRRPLVNGQGTFSRIIKNLKIVGKYFDNISVRVNVDKDNAEHCLELLDILEKEDLKNVIGIYFSQVEPVNNEACVDIASKCYNLKDFSSMCVNLNEHALARGFNVIDAYPKHKNYFCMACHINDFVVDSKGHLYKCWDDAGRPERSFGNVLNLEREYVFHPNNLLYLLKNPYEDEECRECKFLPICAGGCPFRAISNKGLACEKWRHSLEEHLRLFLKYKDKNKFLEKRR